LIRSLSRFAPVGDHTDSIAGDWIDTDLSGVGAGNVLRGKRLCNSAGILRLLRGRPIFWTVFL